MTLKYTARCESAPVVVGVGNPQPSGHIWPVRSFNLAPGQFKILNVSQEMVISLIHELMFSI